MSVRRKIKTLGAALRERNHDAIRALLEDEDRGAMLSEACSAVVLAAKTVGVDWHAAPWRQIAVEHDMELRIAMDIPMQFGWLAPADRPAMVLNTDNLDYYRAMASRGAKKCLTACWRQSLWTQIRILCALETAKNFVMFGPSPFIRSPPQELEINYIQSAHPMRYTRWFHELIVQPTPIDPEQHQSVSYGTHYMKILELTGSVALLEHIVKIDIWWASCAPRWLFRRHRSRSVYPTHKILYAVATRVPIDGDDEDDYYHMALYNAIVRGTAAGLPIAEVQNMLDLWPALLAAMIAHLVEGNLRIRAHYESSRFARFWRIATRLPADLQPQFAATIYSVADDSHAISRRRLVCAGIILAPPTNNQLRFVEAAVLA